ncbi:glycosyltransferase family 1 protein [Ectopseudomonas mendocina]|uniref:Glycosyltransferase family 1 protein n=1 Tax=Ectopseudomonas mendocina TaxID=300 RepID=A0ABZ2RCG4_ECTME
MNISSLRIALISETFPPEVNGVANTLGRLVEGLRAKGHRVQVIRPRQGSDQGRMDDSTLLIRGWPLPGYPGLQWGQSSMHKLLRSWKMQRPDVLYIATEGPLGLSALRSALRLKIPVVTGFHTNFQQYTEHYRAGLITKLLSQYLRWFHNRSQITLVPSISQQIELQRKGYDNLALLSRGVDSQLFHPSKRSLQLRAQWGLKEEDIAVIHVGRLAPEKNLLLLGKTFHAMQTAHPEQTMKLILVGDGPQRKSLEEQLPDAIFCGIQRGEALAAHYASGDLFLFPSLSETFGNVVLEALASGLGVVSYDLAAASLHIRHGHNGVLAAPDDEDDFIYAANWLLDSPETLRRVRLNARAHASQQGWSAIIELFEHFLHSAIEPSAAPLPETLNAPRSLHPDDAPGAPHPH